MFPMSLVLPLLPSVSMEEMATSSSEECEGQLGCGRESHKPIPTNSRRWDRIFSRTVWGRRADAEMKFE